MSHSLEMMFVFIFLYGFVEEFHLILLRAIQRIDETATEVRAGEFWKYVVYVCQKSLPSLLGSGSD